MDGTGASGMPPSMKRPRYATTRQKTCHHCSAAKAKCDRGEGGCARCASRGLVCAYPSPQAQQQQSFVDINAAAAGSVTAGMAHDMRIGSGGGSSSGGSYYGLEVLSGLAVSEHWISSSSSPARQQPVHIPPRTMTTTTTAVNEPDDQLDLRNCSALLSEELACPVNAEDVRNRWLHPYVPMPGQEAKAYPRNVTAFICRVLSSYAGVVRRGRFRRGGCGVSGGRGGVVVPPFIHHGQVCGRDGSGGGEDLPLDTCLRLARALGDRVGEKEVDREDGKEGEEGEEQEKGTRVLREEMDGVYERHGEYDGVTMLSAFQAYLVYSLILFSQTYTSTSSLSSSSSSSSSPSSSVSASSRALLRQAMMNLQDLASSSIRQGIVLLPHHHQSHHHHQHHSTNQRPSWEAWVAAEAKRRALYTMYLFDSALSSLDDLPTFLGTELRGLPAPAGGSLWAAGSREAWGAAYDDCVADWGEEEGEERGEREGDGGFLRIEELWPATTDAAGLARRERRIGLWLEDADEFGMMLYAVTCGTHGV